jgi:hypothetical protein
MVLKIMRNILRVILYMILTICFSCEEQGFIVNCSDCVSEEPKKADIKVKVTDLDVPVYVVVYEGELEDSVIYDSALANLSEISFSVSLNKQYTLSAFYSVAGNFYTAVDAVSPRVRYTKEDCDDPCYFIYDKTADLRLKYRAIGE